MKTDQTSPCGTAAVRRRLPGGAVVGLYDADSGAALHPYVTETGHHLAQSVAVSGSNLFYAIRTANPDGECSTDFLLKQNLIERAAS